MVFIIIIIIIIIIILRICFFAYSVCSSVLLIVGHPEHSSSLAEDHTAFELWEPLKNVCFPFSAYKQQLPTFSKFLEHFPSLKQNLTQASSFNSVIF